ncbi:aromatic di-alanine and TPR containing protein, partial [Rhizoctonia solani AG-3 Rhs1AP]
METSHKLEKIDKDLQFLNRARAQTADDHPSIPLLFDYLGRTHNNRFILLNELHDLEKTIEYKTLTLTMTPDNHPGLSELLCSLAVVHSERFQRLGDLSDMEKAIEYARVTVELTTSDDPVLPRRLSVLGMSHSRRFERQGDLKDLEDAIEYETRALALTPDGHPLMPSVLVNLGASHIRRFQHLGELSDVESAIKYQCCALAMIPDGHPHVPGIFTNLGLSHGSRFKQQGELKDLEKAIEYETRALALTPNGHPLLPGVLLNLGKSHIRRFERLGKLSDVETAIEYESSALALTPEGRPLLPGILASLGTSHTGRFQRLGELRDLDNAIEYQTRALALTPKGRPELLLRLDVLGMSHDCRFKRLGELKDLEYAMEYASRALALTPDGHPGLPGMLTRLGASHSHRFERQGKMSDAESAMEYHSRALALTPDRHPDLPRKLESLGASHIRQFERLGKLSDVETAIKYQSRALAMTPDGHSSLPGFLTNLAASHKIRFVHLSERSDLELAMGYGSRALALTPDNHPDASKLQSNHAITLIYYYQLTRDNTHLRHSLDLFCNASQSLAGAPHDKFRIAQTWADTASIYHPDSCIEAYQTAIDLLPQFIWLGATTNQRYEDLSITKALAVDAAYAAICSSDYSLALEWLEHARCVVWNQSLMLRSPLDQLQSIYPDLATRLRAVADKLHSAGSESRESQALASGSMTPEQVAQEHRRLAKEYEDLLVQIRQLPGFGEFLRPMKAAGLLQAARTGPVVVINCHKDNCDALLILPGVESVAHVALSNFSAQKAQEARRTLESSLRCKGIRDRGVRVCQEPGQKDDMSSVLATLWHNVVKPILDYLGYMNNDSFTSMPHITWCPTGALSFLPLHAAGDYTQPRSRVFDYVISSYTPTLTALLASSPDLLSTSCRLLAVGQANTPGQSALPGTVRELAHVQAYMSDNSQYSQLIGSNATVAAVLDAMEHHDWVHIACHAHQNVTDPTKSGFFLHNGILDLAKINRRSFKGKGLAFLSACQTATGDERLADEAVHLASGMLMAGYSSVIATMWPVHGEDAPLVANNVYAELMKDRRVGNGEAGRALHNAVATLRERVGEEKYERWVPYIHIGS